MTFTSFNFFVFIAIILFLYYILPKKFQIVILVMASLFFCYFAGGKRMVLSLFIATISTWYAAIKIENAESEKQTKVYFIGVILLNIGILVFCKYLNFFIYTGRVVGRAFHSEHQLREISLIAPLGLSFYTLQVLGYLIDVSRKTCKAEKNLLRYAAFSCFFPQLVTGPINRFGKMAETLYERKNFDYQKVTFGLQRVVWGLFKKLVISERMAVLVNTVYGDYYTYNGLYIGFATICFAFQLYTDFSGAMDIALGVSETLGVQMEENFDTPFFARSISEYWRRWHITLGTWMKDYVFYPVLKSELFITVGDKAKRSLGKKKGKKVPTYLGMVVLWFMVGMWHGGAWKYIVGSGLLHCFYIISGQMLEPFFSKVIKLFKVKTDCFIFHLFQNLRTFFLVCVGFVFFRSSSLQDGLDMLKMSVYPNIGIFTNRSFFQLSLGGRDSLIGFFSLGVLFLVSLLQKKYHAEGIKVRMKLAEQNLVFRWMVYYILIFSVIIFGFYGPGYSAGEFIYQNF